MVTAKLTIKAPMSVNNIERFTEKINTTNAKTVGKGIGILYRIGFVAN